MAIYCALLLRRVDKYLILALVHERLLASYSTYAPDTLSGNGFLASLLHAQQMDLRFGLPRSWSLVPKTSQIS